MFKPLNQLSSYGLAIAVSIFAFLLMVGLDPWLKTSETPFLLFFSAVTISALYGGTKQGVITTVLSALLVYYFFYDPKNELNWDQPANLRLLLFILQGFALSYLCGTLRLAQKRIQISLQQLQASQAERDRLVQELETERTRLESILRQMPGGVMIADAASGHLVRANEQVETIIGYNYKLHSRLEEYDLVLPFDGFFPDGRRYEPDEWPLMRSLVSGEVIANEEIELQYRDGSRIFIDVNSRPIRDSQGQIDAAVVIFQDITKRKQVELALLKSQTLLNAILASSPVGLAFLDRDLRYIHVNEALAIINGLPLEAHIGRTLSELFPDWEPLLTKIFQQVIETKEPLLNQELSGRATPASAYRHCLVNFYPVCLNNVEILGMGIAAVDITKLKQTEQSLLETVEHLEMAQRAANAGWWDWDMVSNLVIWSKEYYSLYGLDPIIVPSYKNWLISIVEEDRDRVERQTHATLKKRAALNVEFRVQHPVRGMRWLMAVGRTFYSTEGQPTRMTGITLDITERKQTQLQLIEQARKLTQLNAELRQTTELLAQKNQELNNFTHIVSHDLKAPLRAIANLAEWLEEDLEGQLSPETQRQMQLLQSRVYRMVVLIDGLLTYSRVGRTQVEEETVDVGKLLEEILDSLAPPATFTIVVQPQMPTITAKRLLLIQVFSNLISNAIKHHNRPDGRIEIAATAQGEFYEFSVTDDGLGIAQENHERIFGIFQTLKNSETNENTGIGLSIVRKIVETEGGKIVLKSELGIGTTFRFTWLKQPMCD